MLTFDNIGFQLYLCALDENRSYHNIDFPIIIGIGAVQYDCACWVAPQ